MRAPFQILAIPYRREGDKILYCVLHRADFDQWQFVAGGGEDGETPAEAAKREIFEETGIEDAELLPLRSICSIPTNIFSREILRTWPKGTFVVPEYAFAFPCREEIRLSHEHLACVWLPYDKAGKKLRWDSNRTALYELDCRLKSED